MKLKVLIFIVLILLIKSQANDLKIVKISEDAGIHTDRRAISSSFYDSVAQKTYLCWMGAYSHAMIKSYDHQTQLWSEDKLVGYSPFPDKHNYPGMITNQDGYLLIFHGCHNSTLKMTQSPSPHSMDGEWKDRFIEQAPGASYPFPFITRKGTIYVFYRITMRDIYTDQGYPTDYRPLCYIYSKDGGKTWSESRRFIDIYPREDHLCEIYNGKIAYSPGNQETEESFHIAWTNAGGGPDQHKHNVYHRDVYYAKLNTNDHTLTNISGTNLGNEIDVDESESFCKILDTGIPPQGIQVGYESSVILNSKNEPVVIFGAEGMNRAIWDGNQWDIKKISPVNGEPRDIELTDKKEIKLYLSSGNKLIALCSKDDGITWENEFEKKVPFLIAKCHVIENSRDNLKFFITEYINDGKNVKESNRDLYVGWINQQNIHPRLIVNPSDREKILDKISQQDWAKKAYQEIKNNIDPYVKRHKEDPQWILSRYLMNWQEGKRYTDFQIDSNGTQIIHRTGNAPKPTVKVSMHKRPPVAPDGYRFRVPEIEELIPYDTNDLKYMQTTGPTGKWYWAEPGMWTANINEKFNQLAFQSAFLYWITHEEKYARFACDIIMQWAQGMKYQNCIEGSVRNGCLTCQTLEENRYVPLVFAFDFVYNYFTQMHLDHQIVFQGFQKIADLIIPNGFADNNWLAYETYRLVPCALIQDDTEKRDYYLSYYLSLDSVKTYKDNIYGQKNLNEMLNEFLNESGFWQEPPNYHNGPMTSLLSSAFVAEKNGYPVFRLYPKLLNSTYVLSDFLFPNLKSMSFGDCHTRIIPSPHTLEIGYTIAKKYDDPLKMRISYEINRLISKDEYHRELSGLWGLLIYEPDLESPQVKTFQPPRTDSLGFAQCYLQRNGTDPKTGLMAYLQGATYNHNHANGIAMELYGCGYVLGADPGADGSYDTDVHGEYYIQWAAHNTVVAGGKSQALNEYTTGTRRIGEISLNTMEPVPNTEAVSKEFSFVDVEFFDSSTHSRQKRLLSVVRTSPETGYYLDVFRSDHPVKNEYIYHNIGQKLECFTDQNLPLVFHNTDELNEDFKKKGPGYKYFVDKKRLKNFSNNLIAQFMLEDKKQKVFMKLWVPGNESRDYFMAKAPRTHTAPIPINQLLTPTLVIRQNGQAWNHPFIIVFEPFEKQPSIQAVETLVNDSNLSIIQVVQKKLKRKDLFYISLNNEKLNQIDEYQFQGSFAVITEINDSLSNFYLGDALLLKNGIHQIKSKNDRSVQGNFHISSKKIQYSCIEDVVYQRNNQSWILKKGFNQSKILNQSNR